MMIDTTTQKLHIVAYYDTGEGEDEVGCECKLSPAVLLFAKEMQVQIDKNKKKGDAYKDSSYSGLFAALKNKVMELEIALIDSLHESTVKETADIANFCMFIALNATRIHNE